MLTIAVAAVVGCACGAFCTRFILGLKHRAATAAREALLANTQAGSEALQARLDDTTDLLTDARAEISRLCEQVAQRDLRCHEQVQLLADTKQAMLEQFRLLSHEALHASGQELLSQFQERAAGLLGTLRTESRHQTDAGQKLFEQISSAVLDQLRGVDRTVQELHRARIASESELRSHLESLAAANQSVGAEAAKLRGVLTNSRVRGEWGQLQLRNVAEAAGMLEHCDFLLEEGVESEGKRQRPDMRVKLPNGLSVLIDAKAPMAAYAAALEAGDPKQRKTLMKQHVGAMKAHIREMSERNYPAHPEFRPAFSQTIIFLPNESLFFAAMEADGELLTFAQEHDVILTTPLSLIALLRAVASGWTQVKVNTHALQIRDVAMRLHDRISAFMSDFSEVGIKLEGAVRAYNSAVGRRHTMNASFDRLAEMGVGDQAAILDIQTIDTEVRAVSSPERGGPERVAPYRVTAAIPPLES